MNIQSIELPSNQIPPSAPSPDIGIYSDPVLLLFSGYGFGPGSVTVLVTIANLLLSPLIAQLNDLIAFIHSGNIAVCHSCSLTVSEVLGGS
jgi:hypothetical protein